MVATVLLRWPDKWPGLIIGSIQHFKGDNESSDNGPAGSMFLESFVDACIPRSMITALARWLVQDRLPQQLPDTEAAANLGQ